MNLENLLDEALVKDLILNGFSYKAISEKVEQLFPGKEIRHRYDRASDHQ